MTQLARRPLLLIVRDGWGHNPFPEWNHANAVHLARTPMDERLRAAYPWVQIHTCGEDVGLPAGVMGNSEVGHQNIGAGRIVDQEQMRITRKVRDGSFFAIPELCEAMDRVKGKDAAVHLLGLCSDAGVHSALEHLYALLELAKRRGLAREQVQLHAFGDGRDTPPQSGKGFVQAVEAKMREIGVGRVATVIGRYYAMDRDNRWDRVEKAYRLLTRGEGTRAASATEAFERYYAHATEPSRSGDEFVEATVVGDARPIRAGDSVIFFNFRGDRPREITRAFVFDTFPYEAPDKGGAKGMQGFERGPKIENLYYCTMCDYEKGLPVKVAFTRPAKMVNILGAYASSLGLKQFRCAETEKYPHVTFFFNDYRDEPFDSEDRQIVASPRDVTTYDQKPEMSAAGVTEEMLRRIASDRYDLFILNYANGDMVGHTGNLRAAIKAVETVDACVGRVVDAVLAKGGAAIVTADHGNCEQMIDPATGGPHTAHTTYDVDLIVVDDRMKGRTLREGGRLADIAPTLLAMGGIEKPREMTGESLIT
ncbi:MAG: 2,3-bisphosphoglycerate-independent phosphoglycerate mutase [Planctomycetes bacterium]|nr:2,3-bisphosphoglycerate-independent phosphoglycerate mutase [Planctomycetota bacterium]